MIIILNTLSSRMLKTQQSRGRLIIQAYNGHAQPNYMDPSFHYNIMTVPSLVSPVRTFPYTNANKNLVKTGQKENRNESNNQDCC